MAFMLEEQEFQARSWNSTLPWNTPVTLPDSLQDVLKKNTPMEETFSTPSSQGQVCVRKFGEQITGQMPENLKLWVQEKGLLDH